MKPLETSDDDMTKTSSSNMIEPIVKRNFGNNFHHQNGRNQHQYVHKTHTNSTNPDPSKYKNFSPTYLKQITGCALDNKKVRELLMQNYGKLET